MTTHAEAPQMSGLSGRLNGVYRFAVPLVVVALCAFLSIRSDAFLTGSNLGNVLEQVSMVGIIAMGMAMLLISGNFDLSIGGMVALVGVIFALTVNSMGLLVGIPFALLVGLALGSLNGLLVTRLGVNSLVATLGSGLAFRGIAFLLAGAAPVVLADRGFQQTMSSSILGLPLPAFLLFAVIVLSTLILHHTVGGRQIFAVGTNEEAARYAGIRVRLIRFLPFAITGVFCAISAIILTGLLNSALPSAAETWPLDVIAAAVVGGVSITGGRGSTYRAVTGILLIGIVANGFNLLAIDPNYQSVFTGAIIVVAVAFDSFAQKRAGASR